MKLEERRGKSERQCESGKSKWLEPEKRAVSQRDLSLMEQRGCQSSLNSAGLQSADCPISRCTLIVLPCCHAGITVS